MCENRLAVYMNAGLTGDPLVRIACDDVMSMKLYTLLRIHVPGETILSYSSIILMYENLKIDQRDIELLSHHLKDFDTLTLFERSLLLIVSYLLSTIPSKHRVVIKFYSGLTPHDEVYVFRSVIFSSWQYLQCTQTASADDINWKTYDKNKLCVAEWRNYRALQIAMT